MAKTTKTPRSDTSTKSAGRTASRRAAGDAGAGAPRTTVSEQTETAAGSSIEGGNARSDVSDDELRGLIAETAYYKAKERGFQPGYEQRDWLEAEAEVMNRLGMRR